VRSERAGGPPRVFVGLPAYRGMEIPTARSLLSLVWALDGGGLLDGRFEFLGNSLGEGYGCARNSEEAALAAIELKADVLLHVDADMSFTPEDVLVLLDTWDRSGGEAAVGAMYPASRGGPLVGALCDVPTVDLNGTPGPGAFTGRATAASLVAQQGECAYEARLLGFGLIAIPVFRLELLVRERGFAFHESAMGRRVDGVDSTFCETSNNRRWPLVAELRCKAKHLQRTWE